MEDSEPSGIVVDPGSGVTSRASVVSTGSAECDTRAAERGEEQGDYRDRVASADDLSAPSSGGEGAGCDVHRARGGHSSQGGRGERGGRGAKGNKDLSKRPTRGKVWGVDEIIFLIKAWKVASLLRLPDGQTAKQAAAADFSLADDDITFHLRYLVCRYDVRGIRTALCCGDFPCGRESSGHTRRERPAAGPAAEEARRERLVATAEAHRGWQEKLVMGSDLVVGGDLPPEMLVAGSSSLGKLVVVGDPQPEEPVVNGDLLPVKLVVGDSSPEKLVVVGNSPETLIMAIFLPGELAAGAA
ncbi:hypothetical protein PF005_g440 [Phytophthora fragariae]|uniref:Uncharacterized protein n=2 Tax=Phytophthora fragariae TaxID=53985 RepID=A0A6A4EVQ9_9STRA|nr:hypothetical protein PF005_g440 [Phytophthora fragariae]KAE9330417.1 hypothetical protein PF001_g400 [Phytophthora fragariae]